MVFIYTALGRTYPSVDLRCPVAGHEMAAAHLGEGGHLLGADLFGIGAAGPEGTAGGGVPTNIHGIPISFRLFMS